jgi:integrating conjugative element protein (TIGR03755 family)
MNSPYPSRKVAAALFIALALPVPASALTSGTFSDSRWYYKIGGADSVMAPLNAHVSSATIGGSVNLGLGFNCSSFNPVLGLANTLNNAAQNIQSVLVNAASSAIASAPALILQRASPGLYELYQQLLSYANASVSLATKSCEQMQSDIAHGSNPYDHWLTLSKSYTWRDQMGQSQSGSSSVDVLQALGVVDNKGGDGGVPWVGGQNAGGKNQPPILAAEWPGGLQHRAGERSHQRQCGPVRHPRGAGLENPRRSGRLRQGGTG